MLHKAVVLIVLLSVCLQAKAVQVEASIKPLALLIEPLLLEGDSVKVLVNPGASPHDYALKVSDLQRLNAADLVVWAGPNLERFLVKPLDAVKSKSMELSLLESMNWPLGNESAEEHSAHDEHDHGEHDPHFWLDPINAQLIARAVSERLAQANPEQAEQYKSRLAVFIEQLEDLHCSLSAQLKPLSPLGFAVYHKAYDHFVERYKLNQLAFITVSPEQKPGARHLYQLRSHLAGEALCVFTDIDTKAKTAEHLAADLGLKIAPLDPLGVKSDNYLSLMHGMGSSFDSCLSPSLDVSP